MQQWVWVKVLVLFCLASGINEAAAQQGREQGGSSGYRGSNGFNRLDVAQMAAGMDRNAEWIQSTLDQERGSVACGAAGSDFGRAFSKQIVNIHIAYGYKDVHPGYVEDKPTKEALIQHVTRDCRRDQSLPGAYAACGFRPEVDQQRRVIPDTYGKWMDYPDGSRHYIRLRLAHSSQTFEDHINKADLKSAAPTPEQLSQSRKSQELFLGGISHAADVVFYNGHARGGGGPDFFPGRLLGDNISVNFPWYRANTPGLKDMREALNSRRASGGEPLAVLALFACLSQGLFVPTVQQISPSTTVLANPAINWWDDEVLTIPAALNAVIGRLCRDPALRTINAPSIDAASRIQINPGRLR